MDLYNAIKDLREEKRRLDVTIAMLEGMVAGQSPGAGSRRGRKSMSASERAAVSKRMKAYWAARKRPAKPGS